LFAIQQPISLKKENSGHNIPYVEGGNTDHLPRVGGHVLGVSHAAVVQQREQGVDPPSPPPVFPPFFLRATRVAENLKYKWREIHMLKICNISFVFGILLIALIVSLFMQGIFGTSVLTIDFKTFFYCIYCDFENIYLFTSLGLIEECFRNMQSSFAASLRSKLTTCRL
jgi:hypothetical protein